MEVEMEQLKKQRKNKSISDLQEKLTQSEERCRRLQSMVNTNSSDVVRHGTANVTGTEAITAFSICNSASVTLTRV